MGFARNNTDGPLSAGIEGGELVIRIGIARLAWCQRHDAGPMKGCKISDQKGCAEDIAREMHRDDEVGVTPVSSFLDQMAKAAAESGSAHITMPARSERLRA